jgi:cytochrome c oxidase subunit II
VQYRNAFFRGLDTESVIAGAIFLLVLVAMVVAAVISRRRRETGSSQQENNNRVEFAYLGVIAIVAAFLAFFSLHLNNTETTDPGRPSVVVSVEAFQWCWRFSYPGQSVTVTGQCQGRGAPTLVLPAHRLIRINVTSNDVIHGFWVPYLKWKIYAYPGHVNGFDLTLDHTGRWVGRCSEFCGLYHYDMDFYVRVVAPAQFTDWLRTHRGRLALAGNR